MGDLYSRIESICWEKKHQKVGAMCAATGISRGTLTDLKNGRSKSLSAKNLQLISDYLDVSTDFLLGAENKKILADPKTSEEVDEYIRGLDDPAELMRIMELALKRQRELGGK